MRNSTLETAVNIAIKVDTPQFSRQYEVRLSFVLAGE